MPPSRLLPLLCLLALPPAQAGITHEDSVLSETEQVLFDRIAGYYPDLHFSHRVTRYFCDDPKADLKTPTLTEMVFEPKEGLYFGEYVGYQVFFSEQSTTIEYSFDAGTASRGGGSLIVTPDAVYRVERTCTTAGCSESVSRNGEQVWAGR